MNRPTRPEDTGFHDIGNSWMPTSPSQFMDDPILSRPAVPHPQRKPQGQALTPQAHDWLARLPPRYQPMEVARRHPHIVNRLSMMWTTPAEARTHLSELMLSNRPGREGFAFEVITELADLQSLLELMMSKGERF